jgi:hypothetical protein
MAFNALVGSGMIAFFATSQSVFQLSADARNRGRVMGLYSMAVSGANPFGNMVAGPAADRWNEALVLRAQGVGCGAALLGVLVILFRGGRPGERVSRSPGTPG